MKLAFAKLLQGLANVGQEYGHVILPPINITSKYMKTQYQFPSDLKLTI